MVSIDIETIRLCCGTGRVWLSPRVHVTGGLVGRVAVLTGTVEPLEMGMVGGSWIFENLESRPQKG